MNADSALYVGATTHVRLRPRRHFLRYRMYSLLVDLDRLAEIDRRLRWLSVNRANCFAFYEKDHGVGEDRGLVNWVRSQLRDAALPHDGAILLLTMPRILGYVFNPISIYFCHDAAGRLSAMLYEVNNTFGERHIYLLEATAALLTEAPYHQRCAKRLHVSPFIALDMEYRFRVLPPNATSERFSLAVDVHDEEGRLLVARYEASRRPLDDANLLRLFFSHPLLTLKVIGGIHWEALRLWLKGCKVHHKPADAPVAVTILKAGN